MIKPHFLLALFLCSTFNSFFAFSQDIQYVPLAEAGQKEIDADAFKAIDSYFDDVTIAGLGESTHGTSEFHTYRAELFKYLIENKDFNTLFLEADYADCVPISDYVAGESVDIREAMKALYWPWQTEELLTLIEWMRTYNQERALEDQLQFVGVDGQWPDNASMKINDLLLSYELEPLDSNRFPIVSNQEFQKLRKREYKDMLAYLRTYKEKDVSDFSKEDQQKYQLLIRNLEQSLETRISKCSTLRDSFMAQNMLSKLRERPNTKAIFWAHNEHVYKVLSHYDKKRAEQHGITGGVLKHAIKEQYVSIMQDFDNGSFIAYHKINDSKNENFENYDLGEVMIDKSIAGSYGEKLRNLQEELVFIDFSENKQVVGEYKLHTIGAVFNPAKDNPQQTSQFNYCPGGECYDALLFTKESTPIQLLQD
ncbi:erythromycin esterase [Marivirga sericea]|uniref:Erythromycin esterase n=1 Tax=Marivirga sericea TaxID=1028 RepID=A0A1X7LD11_9BACT|nr:erythromycin esterase family protein [Marivirga sericea]SMG51731.1 erythromycin esterase [Marivirga sericea]